MHQGKKLMGNMSAIKISREINDLEIFKRNKENIYDLNDIKQLKRTL